MKATNLKLDVDSTSKHEAGHVVMALSVGCQVHYAIVRADGTGASCIGPGRGRRQDPFAMALVSWGGEVAEGTFRNHIGEGDALFLRHSGLQWGSIKLIGEVASRRFKTYKLHHACNEVAKLLKSNVGRRVLGTTLYRVAVEASPLLPAAALSIRQP